MEKSKIEWCDNTFNPWEGCTKVSPGCVNCYAEARDQRFTGGVHWGRGAPRRRTSAANWAKPLKWNQTPIAACHKCGWLGELPTICPTPGCCTFGSEMDTRNPRVFSASLADWLDAEVPIEWLADLLALIHATPNLDWLLLTKRPENWRTRIYDAWGAIPGGAACYEMLRDWLRGDAPANIWVGTTAEDQTRADERVPHLLKIPARVRFLSCEPLLGPVDLSWEDDQGRQGSYLPRFDHRPEYFPCLFGDGSGKPIPLHAGVDWIIAGGESGPGARPMHPDWARSLRDQCQAAGVPFLFKQWGEWLPAEVHPPVLPNELRRITVTTPSAHPCPDHPEFHDWPDGKVSARAGKKAAGRELDGRTWDEFPSVEARVA